jgi:hypothetical protein
MAVVYGIFRRSPLFIFSLTDSETWRMSMSVLGKSGTMKARRKVLLVFLPLGILFVCLAFTEFPELLTLTNNTSNDFTIYLPSVTTGAYPTYQVSDPQPKSTKAGRSGADCEFPAITKLATRFRSPDLLVLHCLWRT